MLPPPAGVTLVVRRYWVVKFAVMVAGPVIEIVWEIGPPSLQLFQEY
jgi:hypothetical protein